MTVAIMQPYFFPYIGYWQLINAVDTFVIFDDVNYINKGYINRNNILINGQKQLFTLELIGASQNKKIHEIQIGTNRNKLLKTIEITYKKAPYFQEIFPLISTILQYEEKNLAKFIGHSLEKISSYLNIDTRFIYSSEIDKQNLLTGEKKIINIVKLLEAKQYINSIGGQELYDKKTFLNNGLELAFLQTELRKYQQFNNTFIPYLSIIDIMMFNAIEDIRTMLNQYNLV
ncbi:WbqC family protein [Sulfuricurvum sp.]|uniref:WbqC family protein n=1 Tax=Sulfuricurvum sp. TaxID=2025608 RepID=UPI003BB1F013